MTIPNNYFIFIDVFIIALYCAFLAVSYRNGFLYGLLDLFYTLICVAAAWFLSPVMASVLPLISLADTELAIFRIEPIVNTTAYFVLIFLLLKLVGLIIVPLFKKVSEIPLLGTLNKLLGMVLGFLNATVIILGLGMLLNTPLIKNGNEIKEGTFLRHIDTYSKMAVNAVVDNIDFSVLKEKFEDFDVDTSREAFKNWLMEREFMK